METCLFTGEQLPANTRMEHTIPRTLAGRIRSRRVSSDSFNNASSPFDEALAEPYRTILNYLAPLLASEHHQANVPVASSHGIQCVLEPGGRLQPRGMQVVRRDPEGRPTEVLVPNGGDERAMVARMREMSGHDPVRTEPATSPDYVHGQCVAMSTAQHVAALKCGLLTFDELLHDEPRRFTRDDALTGVRQFVCNRVMEDARDMQAYERHVMGLQHDKLPDIAALSEKCFGPPPHPFHHLLIAAGNAGSRYLDLVWVVAGVDAYGFRLTDEWTSCDFTYVLRSSLLRGGTIDGPLRLPTTSYVCCPTDLRAMARGQDVQAAKQHAESATRRVLEHRNHVYREAVDLVERECPCFVHEGILRSARAAWGRDCPSVRVVDLFAERLRRLFSKRLEEPTNQAIFDACISQVTSSPDDVFISETLDAGDEAGGAVSWPKWLEWERGILDRLRDSIGLPGEQFTEDVRIERPQ